MMQNWMKIAGIGIICATLGATAAQAKVSITHADAHWKVTASDEPLTGVLGAISKQAGIKVSGTAKLLEDPALTGVYQGNLETVLRRLLRGSDYAFESTPLAGGGSRITRLVVLSGAKGKAAPHRVANVARRLPSPAKPVPLTEEEKRQGGRVNALLEKRARLAAGGQGATVQNEDNQDQNTSGGSGITRNPDGSFDISPEAQARMAEATRRAQQDLQALVSAIRRNDQNQGNQGNQNN